MSKNKWISYIKNIAPKHLIDPLVTFLSPINLKCIQNVELTPKLQKTLSTLGGYTPLLFIYDIEFQHYKNERHLLEFGGMIFLQNNTQWNYLGSFHFNLPPIKNVSQLKVLQSKYGTVTKETQKKMESIEKNYLYYDVLAKYKNDLNTFQLLYENYINTKLAKKKNIQYINPTKDNVDRIIKMFKNSSFTLTKNDIGKSNFDKLWKFYLNDTYVKKRVLKPSQSWLTAFRTLLINSVSVVKGNMDIIAIENLLKNYKLAPISNKFTIHDIAIYNSAFREKCSSAELENTYWCLIEKSLIDPELKASLKPIYKSLCLQDGTINAHNPLVDSFYTLVVALTMSDRFDLHN